MFCSRCGTQIPDDSAFCHQCGAAIAAGKAPETVSKQFTQPTQPGAPQSIRICEWCGESISVQALRCPRCQKWRKDIDQERALMYTFGLGLLISVVIFWIGLASEWWGSASEFSFQAFINSGAGILIVAAAAIIFALSFYYYAKVSTKIGSWWWF